MKWFGTLPDIAGYYWFVAINDNGKTIDKSAKIVYVELKQDSPLNKEKNLTTGLWLGPIKGGSPTMSPNKPQDIN